MAGQRRQQRTHEEQCEVFAWNPRRPAISGRLGAKVPVRRRVNNFGDLLGPLIVERMTRRLGLDFARRSGDWQLLSVGSVLHFARSGAVVWGTGVNGKVPLDFLQFDDLDVRAVRGPRTAQILRDNGVHTPDVFGDPGLLVSTLLPELRRSSRVHFTHRVAVVPNLNDRTPTSRLGKRDVLVNPRGKLTDVLSTLANAEYVVSSSLHGLVVAESFGVPARMFASSSEPIFKYRDYYEGTGRPNFYSAASVDEALAVGGEEGLNWDPEPLLSAFPGDLWRSASS